ncbi:MAG TPA: hypothetical protein VGR57_11555 [Ktedonobacterales bacterium]|nr:hypothetical protein [Ktedonobacterales bacterium]
MTQRSWRTVLLSAGILALALPLTAALSACGSGTTVAITNTPTPTITPTPVPSCATILPGAGATSAPAGFEALHYPTGAVMKPLASSAGGAGQFTVQQTDVCFTGMPSDVNGPFSGRTSVFANLLGAGWGLSTTFPTDGQTQAACASGNSCLRDSGEHYVALESIQSPLTGFVTYHLRLATPPAAPTCNATYYGPSVAYTYAFGNWAVPPLTKESDFALGGGHAGGYDYGLCSAGTPASILAFMQASVTAHGDTPHQVTAASFCVSYSQGSGASTVYGDYTFRVSTGNEWSVSRSAPIYPAPHCA